MNLKTTITDMLSSARKVVTDGAEVIPAWRITMPEGQFLILTRFDPSKPEQASRVLKLMQRFMVWRMALGYVLVAESRVGAAPKTTDGVGWRRGFLAPAKALNNIKVVHVG